MTHESQNPDNADDQYSDTYYDIVVWSYYYQEWEARGNQMDWEGIVDLLRIKRCGAPMPALYRVVLVETETRHTDVTEAAEEILAQCG